jgi:hypothetical protein
MRLLRRLNPSAHEKLVDPRYSMSFGNGAQIVVRNRWAGRRAGVARAELAASQWSRDDMAPLPKEVEAQAGEHTGRTSLLRRAPIYSTLWCLFTFPFRITRIKELHAGRRTLIRKWEGHQVRDLG